MAPTADRAINPHRGNHHADKFSPFRKTERLCSTLIVFQTHPDKNRPAAKSLLLAQEVPADQPRTRTRLSNGGEEG